MKKGVFSIVLNLNFIKKRRKKLGYTLLDMAKKLGFKNGSTYLKYESGTYSFKAEHLPILAKTLDCTIDDFFIKNIAKTEIFD